MNLMKTNLKNAGMKKQGNGILPLPCFTSYVVPLCQHPSKAACDLHLVFFGVFSVILLIRTVAYLCFSQRFVKIQIVFGAVDYVARNI